MVCACMSVGKPGNGSVCISMAFSGFWREAHAHREPYSMLIPICSYFLRTKPRCLGSNPLTRMGSPVRAPMARNVPASMRSPTTACSQGCNSVTPWISITGVPAPIIWAPISFKRLARSTISGSRAALSITVVPFAKTDAIIKFSVAPTEAKARETVSPTIPFGAEA